MSEAIQTVNVAALREELLVLLRDPLSNIVAALILLGMAVILLILVVGGITAIALRRSSKRRNSRELAELQHLLAVLEADDSEGAVSDFTPAPQLTLQERIRDYPWLPAVAMTSGFLLLLWVSLGVSTASTAVCAGCHDATPHSNAVRAGVPDAHAQVGCVRCHESGGWLGAVSTEVPVRLVHFVNGMKRQPNERAYGAVVSAPCYRCHRSIARETTLDEERGVKMAHQHPLDAGAECRDCHTSGNGVVSSTTVGMTPCLRCHDGKIESADCDYCHTKDVGYATRATTGPGQMSGRELIETPDCGGCHNQEKSCDPCHGGVRMPHTELFKWWGHAREGVKDVWFNDGKACGTCHTASRRPCTKCHTFLPGHPTDIFKTSHQVQGTGACDSCHNGKAYVAGRDLCALCHSKPYVTQ